MRCRRNWIHSQGYSSTETRLILWQSVISIVHIRGKKWRCEKRQNGAERDRWFCRKREIHDTSWPVYDPRSTLVSPSLRSRLLQSYFANENSHWRITKSTLQEWLSATVQICMVGLEIQDSATAQGKQKPHEIRWIWSSKSIGTKVTRNVTINFHKMQQRVFWREPTLGVHRGYNTGTHEYMDG